MHNLKSVLTITCSFLCLIYTNRIVAQTNYIQHFNDVDNRSIDYAPSNEYVLLGEAYPATIGGMSNVSLSLGFALNRIQLQVIDANTMNTSIQKTYCTQDEVNAVPENCPALSVIFFPQEAKRTQDGGYIICGYVRRDGETSTCMPGVKYANPFLLKVDMTGAVQWYKRYDQDIWFYSVIEDPATGNFIVAGESDMYNQGFAFMMGTNSTGTPLWANEVASTIPQFPTLGTYNQYLKVAKYENSGSTYYAFIGSSSITGPSNFLLALTDAAGTIYTNTALSTYGSGQRVINGRDIHDAYDNDVVIVGEGYGWGVVLLKIDPLTLSTNFMNQYDLSNGNDNLSFGITMAASGGDIYMTGEEYGAGAYYFKVDNTGNILTYQTFNNGDARRGLDVIYNTSLGYAVASGNADPVSTTFATIDKYTNYCATDNTALMSATSLTPSTVAASITSRNVQAITDYAVDFDLMPNEGPVCGGSLKQGTAGVETLASSKMLIIAPNPANDQLNVQVPALFYGGNLKIVDILGKEVFMQQLDRSTEVHIDISYLHPGVYNLVATNNGVVQQTRFVKQ